MDLFAAHTTLVVLSYVVLALGIVGSAVALGVIGEFVVRNRRARLDRQESIGSYYRELAHTR